ncbi:MAG: polyhydroxyalkanoate synthesis repressor PhaR [Phyllobacteriaceae bacterium]|nr:polyhydroxyalkanoate synthesis repressor PhaR [Phyllobacteriaceae bacterium]
MSEDQAPSAGQPKSEQPKSEQSKNATVIKKYANRRLYNTATSTYVTLEDLARMVKEGTDFIVYDAKSGEDITRTVLTQIIFEEENKGDNNLLPINFLRQLIRFYGDSMQGMVPGYLEFSLGNLMKEQDKVRKQMLDAFGGDAFKTMEETAKRNMQLFQDSLKMFTPFGAGMPNIGAGFANPFAAATRGSDKPAASASSASASSAGPSRDDLQSLKDQLAAMQQKIDQLNR